MKKVKIKFFGLHFIIFVFLLSSYNNSTNGNSNNPYGLNLIDKIESYKQSISKNADMELVDLEKLIPGIKLDIRYATKNNFTGEIIYK